MAYEFCENGTDDAVTSSLVTVPDREGDEGTYALTVLPPNAAAQSQSRAGTRGASSIPPTPASPMPASSVSVTGAPQR